MYPPTSQNVKSSKKLGALRIKKNYEISNEAHEVFIGKYYIKYKYKPGPRFVKWTVLSSGRERLYSRVEYYASHHKLRDLICSGRARQIIL